MSAIDRLLDFATADHVLPSKVRADTLRLLADTLAVGAAGASDRNAEAVLRAALRWGHGKDARTIGDDVRLPAGSAAFVNGFRIHCLEWDAVHEPAVVHALSVVTAAVAAAIDMLGEVAPDDALAAVAVGVEVAAGLGDAASSPLTFFRPATAGCLGAALAAARIIGAPADAALGLAYGFASGTMQAHVEGSIALPLQIGQAARAAVTAAELAAASLTGPRDVLDGPFGYFALFDQGNSAALVADLGSRWRISEVSTKPFACGRASHGLLSGIAELGLRAEELVSVRLEAPPLVKRLVGRHLQPDMTPAYARLCGGFLAALMISDGRIDPRRFTRSAFSDADLARIAALVRIEENGSADLNALGPQRLIVETREGTRELEIAHVLGSPEAPMSAEQSAAKQALAAKLTVPNCDSRVFSDPLAYMTRAA